jgi:surfeit locus 1 family protein
MNLRAFRPRPLLLLATLAFCALAVAAGQWQAGRAADKAQLQARQEALAQEPPVVLPAGAIQAADFVSRRVIAEGEFDARRAILLDNRVLNGRPGYHVVTPLRLAGSERYVLVNRGWVAAGRTRAELPTVPTPPGVQRIEGVAVAPGPVYELGELPPEGPVWQNLVLERYAAWSGLAVQPIVVQQTTPAADGLAREWPRPDAGVEKHRIYALQWYTFAALAAAIYVFFGFRRRRDAS